MQSQWDSLLREIKSGVMRSKSLTPNPNSHSKWNMPVSILDDLLRGIRTTTAEGTLLAGQQFAAAVPENTAITLRGDLGAGKTTFVQGMARAWGITQPVTSPTYS